MRTTNLDTLLSELDILPHYVDDPSRPLRLALALLAVLLLLLMLFWPSTGGKGDALLSSSPSRSVAQAPAANGTPAHDLS